MSETDLDTRKVIAIAGAGDLGRYVCEEFLKSSSFVPIVLSRGVSSPNQLSRALQPVPGSQPDNRNRRTPSPLETNRSTS